MKIIETVTFGITDTGDICFLPTSTSPEIVYSVLSDSKTIKAYVLKEESAKLFVRLSEEIFGREDSI